MWTVMRFCFLSVSRVVCIMMLMVSVSVHAEQGARTKAYDEAIRGDHEVTGQDRVLLSKIDKVTMPSHKHYWRLNYGIGDGNIEGIKNTSTLSSAQPTETKAKLGNIKLSQGLGKRIEKRSYGVDFLYLSDIDYTSNPMLVGGSNSIEAGLKSMALFGTASYDLIQTKWGAPYVSASLGVARHESKATTRTTGGSIVSSVKTNNTQPGYRLAAGLRVFVSALNGYFDFGYQRTDLGKVKIGAIDNAKLESKRSGIDGLFLGYHYEY